MIKIFRTCALSKAARGQNEGTAGPSVVPAGGLADGARTGQHETHGPAEASQSTLSPPESPEHMGNVVFPGKLSPFVRAGGVTTADNPKNRL